MGFLRTAWHKCVGRDYIRENEHREKLAKTIPKGWLFHSDGWGPVKPADLPFKRYKGPLYPAPDYAEYALAKERPAFSDSSRDACNEGRSAWASGRIRQAQSSYDRAMDLCPENPEFMFEQAQLLWSQNRLNEARCLLEKALILKPDFVSARVSLFRVCLQLDDKVTPFKDWMIFARTDDWKHRRGLHHALANEVGKAVGLL